MTQRRFRLRERNICWKYILLNVCNWCFCKSAIFKHTYYRFCYRIFLPTVDKKEPFVATIGNFENFFEYNVIPCLRSYRRKMMQRPFKVSRECISQFSHFWYLRLTRCDKTLLYSLILDTVCRLMTKVDSQRKETPCFLEHQHYRLFRSLDISERTRY